MDEEFASIAEPASEDAPLPPPPPPPPLDEIPQESANNEADEIAPPPPESEEATTEVVETADDDDAPTPPPPPPPGLPGEPPPEPADEPAIGAPVKSEEAGEDTTPSDDTPTTEDAEPAVNDVPQAESNEESAHKPEGASTPSEDEVGAIEQAAAPGDDSATVANGEVAEAVVESDSPKECEETVAAPPAEEPSPDEQVIGAVSTEASAATEGVESEDTLGTDETTPVADEDPGADAKEVIDEGVKDNSAPETSQADEAESLAEPADAPAEDKLAIDSEPVSKDRLLNRRDGEDGRSSLLLLGNLIGHLLLVFFRRGRGRGWGVSQAHEGVGFTLAN